MKKRKHKTMTIRYNARQEKEIQALMMMLGEKTMAKAFLKTPGIVKKQLKEIEGMSRLIERQGEKIYKFREIAGAWDLFNKKLEKFVR